MDTKLKKSKAIVSLVSFFLSIGILIATAIFGISFLVNYDYAMQYIDDLYQEDYQETNAFRSELSRTLNYILRSMNAYSSTSTGAVWEGDDLASPYEDYIYYLSEDNNSFGLDNDTARNLLYQAGTSSDTDMYTNDTEHRNLYRGTLPDGYNFRLIFDGKTVSIEIGRAHV